MPHAHANGIQLHYDIQGQGQPLLLIMGLGAPAANWDQPFVEAMTRTHQVITYDNRGTGQSDKPDEDYSIALFASDAVGLLDELQLPKAHVFGISMGGMIAQELAIHYPQRSGQPDSRLHYAGRQTLRSGTAGIHGSPERPGRTDAGRSWAGSLETGLF